MWREQCSRGVCVGPDFACARRTFLLVSCQWHLAVNFQFQCWCARGRRRQLCSQVAVRGTLQTHTHNEPHRTSRPRACACVWVVTNLENHFITCWCERDSNVCVCGFSDAWWLLINIIVIMYTICCFFCQPQNFGCECRSAHVAAPAGSQCHFDRKSKSKSIEITPHTIIIKCHRRIGCLRFDRVSPPFLHACAEMCVRAIGCELCEGDLWVSARKRARQRPPPPT